MSNAPETPAGPDTSKKVVDDNELLPRPRPAFTYLLVTAAIAVAVAALIAGRRPPAHAIGPQLPAPPPQRPAGALPPPPAPSTNLQQPANPQRPRVELVFALDTTSSMSGLIEGAKRKIWSLASFVAQGQPTPDLRVGLVAYRDVGDEYVTRVHDLDDDLDRVYARLRRFRAEGGGDTPEHVARALHESVHKMSWTRTPGVVRIIYLVGDAPPHDDYEDGFNWSRAARAAVNADIAVHTIRCGVDESTEAVWRKIASIGRGQFMSVGQDGGMRDVRTPYDEELARLHDELASTTIAYGDDAEEARAVMATAAAAPAPVKAERARFMSSKGKAIGGRGDLIADAEAGVVDVDRLAPAAMPRELANLAPPARKAEIAKRSG
ncbi:MAG TPA: vWA domain-containing protein, partial [Polyangia bacterium]